MLKIGKLDSDVLKKLVIDAIKFKRKEVKVRAGIGEDCAVIDFGDYDCVISTDPITAAVNEIGRLSIHISCNDIASNGVEPLGITLAVLLPEGTTEEEVSMIMAQAGEAAEQVGVEIIGGHTEVTKAVRQPVITSTAFGRAVSGSSQSAADMRPGDYILMTKQAGLEGTGIIASDREDELKTFLSEDEIAHAKEMLKDVSVVKEGVAAGRIGTSGMHDVTEGGILGAVWEVCHIADLGAELFEDEIAVDDVTLKMAEHYGFDYLRLISSGCMIIGAPAAKKDAILAALKDAHIRVSCIGRVKEKADGLVLRKKSGETVKIAPPGPDELYRVIK